MPGTQSQQSVPHAGPYLRKYVPGSQTTAAAAASVARKASARDISGEVRVGCVEGRAGLFLGCAAAAGVKMRRRMTRRAGAGDSTAAFKFNFKLNDYRLIPY